MVVLVRSTLRDTDAIEMLKNMGAEVEYYLKTPHKEYDFIIDDRSPHWTNWEETLDILSLSMVTLDSMDESMVGLDC